MTLARTLEPETMDAFDEAVAYLEMNHAEVNRIFADDLFAGGTTGPRVIDLGCGPAILAIEIASRDQAIEVMAVDLSTEMLGLAKQEIDFAGMLEQIMLHQADAKTMTGYEDAIADTVVSNSLIHHLEQADEAIKTAMRLVKPEGRVFIRDLMRPESESAVESLVQLYAGDENDVAKQLLRQSLHAALTLDEIRDTAAECGIDGECVQATSDRHWTIDWTRP
ncbi:UbiE/COQ5 methyltransferase [Rhodopirellula maiorica SM1]|uniref:UbiE/COQ5 methyltransferase n=1 Tax=Rhodopirellula maiorica SM1 TaxID=1265738 RepID=M5R8K8_9BACT|nr:class I SAM-dependent methyltransferase [Rhodopirellula maiorica]EMI15813.1 UbiE/COQ5 methyltransferase [Rhodopirellula maiorica SM1]